MYIVTGAAGFIGSNLVRGLNARGIDNIIAVDDLSEGDKFRHLAQLNIAHYMDKNDFMRDLLDHRLQRLNVQAVFHQGASSDTMNHDGAFMMRNNYQYSRDIFLWCQDAGIPLIYASSAAVYGGSNVFSEHPDNEKPLNVYGYSKLLMDHVLRRSMAEKGRLKAPVAALRYFNVYGNNEDHKGRMASVAYHQFWQFWREGQVTLFGAYDGFDAGCQNRDFIHVDDVVKVNLFFMDQFLARRHEISGVYNVGTGQSATFNQLSQAVVNNLRHLIKHEEALPLETLQQKNLIRYRDFPSELMDKYQSHTQADITRLRNAGYDDEFLHIDAGVARYMNDLYQHYVAKH